MCKLRIVFMGTPAFAVESLKVLVEQNFNIVGVITAPDRPAGRGQHLAESEVKKYAKSVGLKVLQPEKLKNETFIAQLKALQADLNIVVAFRMLPEIVWNMPRLGTYNLHASLLPKYRGAAPINWAIINGEKETGITTFKLSHEIDTGNILFSEKVAITESVNAGELHDILMEKGGQLILKTVRAICESDEQGRALNFTPQDNGQASHAPKIFRDDCKINWNLGATEIHNFIRGLSPYPAAHMLLKRSSGQIQWVKIFSAGYEMSVHSYPNGHLLTDWRTFLNVCCGNGVIKIYDLQLEGKRRMPIEDFLRGYNGGPEVIVV